MARVPTHICLDCGALGYAGGYHDHGGGNAGDTATLVELLETVRKADETLDLSRDAAVELAKALRLLVNAPLPPDLELERPYWIACRNARATLSTYESLTGVDGEQDGPDPSKWVVALGPTQDDHVLLCDRCDQPCSTLYRRYGQFDLHAFYCRTCTEDLDAQ